MFDNLTDRLGGVFDKLRGRGALKEEDVRSAMREVRIALLEADVALPVVRDFINTVTEQAVGQSVLKSVAPGQQVVKIVNDALARILGEQRVVDANLLKILAVARRAAVGDDDLVIGALLGTAARQTHGNRHVDLTFLINLKLNHFFLKF
jgi:signal recognition particle GTPase